MTGAQQFALGFISSLLAGIVLYFFIKKVAGAL